MSDTAICIPTYNRKDKIARAIDSILSQRAHIDVHVFDNASTDDTIPFLETTYQKSIFIHKSDKNIGYVGNINNCLSLCKKYNWIGILHSDDIHKTDSIKTFYRNVKNQTNSGILFSKCDVIDENDSIILHRESFKKTWHKGDEAIARTENHIPCSATFYNTQAIQNAGLLSEDFPYSADEEYNARIAKNMNISEMDRTIASYREHPEHLMYDTWEKDDFIQNFEKMKLLIESYKKSSSTTKEAIIKNIAIQLYSRSLILTACNRKKIANKFLKNLTLKAPSNLIHPLTITRILTTNIPFISPMICSYILKIKSYRTNTNERSKA